LVVIFWPPKFEKTFLELFSFGGGAPSLNGERGTGNGNDYHWLRGIKNLAKILWSGLNNTTEQKNFYKKVECFRIR
jgi:hypothetical protein